MTTGETFGKSLMVTFSMSTLAEITGEMTSLSSDVMKTSVSRNTKNVRGISVLKSSSVNQWIILEISSPNTFPLFVTNL